MSVPSKSLKQCADGQFSLSRRSWNLHSPQSLAKQPVAIGVVQMEDRFVIAYRKTSACPY
jgi:hypothetical protein